MTAQVERPASRFGAERAVFFPRERWRLRAYFGVRTISMEGNSTSSSGGITGADG
jgi:hypothetical protein